MARIADLTDVTDEVIERAVEWYAHTDVPPTFRRLNPLAVRTAIKLAGGDWRRCVANEDGSITVANRPVWT